MRTLFVLCTKERSRPISQSIQKRYHKGTSGYSHCEDTHSLRLPNKLGDLRSGMRTLFVLCTKEGSQPISQSIEKRYRKGTLGYSRCEDTHSLRLPSKLGDLRSGMRTLFVLCTKEGSRPISQSIEKRYHKGTFFLLAERKGFEPLIPVRVYTISSRAP